MLTSVVLFTILLGGAFGAPKLHERIVGGNDAKTGEVPHIVSLRGLNRHACGASIISDRYILTAAHCVHKWTNRPDLFSVQYGVTEITEKEPNVVPVKRIIVHENYIDSGNYPNDIAVIELNGEIKFGPNVSPVRLPTPFESPGDDATALLAGWGLDKTGGKIMINLQRVNIRVFSDEECASIDRRYDSDLHICAGVRGGGKGQCTGDSGGPLTVDGTQYGIVSWSEKPCASAGNPGFFTKVAAQRNWIRQQTGV